MEKIISVVCQEFQVGMEQLLQTKRGTRNEARDVVIYLIRDSRMEPYRNIADQFQVISASAISTSVARVKKRLAHDPIFRRRIEELYDKFETK